MDQPMEPVHCPPNQLLTEWEGRPLKGQELLGALERVKEINGEFFNQLCSRIWIDSRLYQAYNVASQTAQRFWGHQCMTHGWPKIKILEFFDEWAALMYDAGSSADPSTPRITFHEFMTLLRGETARRPDSDLATTTPEDDPEDRKSVV